jgi:hypothetical protein
MTTAFPNGITADITGDITGNITGNITGDVTGDVTGNVVGAVQQPMVVVSADGAIAIPAGNTLYSIDKAGIAAMTLVDPTAVTHDGIVLTFMSTTANAHTLDLVTGINGGVADVGTYGGAAGDVVSIVAIGGVWYQLLNTNVTFV